MPANIGRAIELEWGSNSPATIPGVREKGIALNGNPVDVTSDEDDGWRTLLEEPGENQINISVSGVTKSDVLRDAWFNGDRLDTAVITFPDGGVLTGQFLLATYNETGTYNDAITFEAELQSSGVITYTPGP